MTLNIQVDTCCQIEGISLEIVSYLESRGDVYYFKTLIHKESDTSVQGLLRIGSALGGLQRELLLRDYLKDHKMISPLLKVVRDSSIEVTIPLPEDIPPPTESEDYLEEEYYPEEVVETVQKEKILILSEYPENNLELTTEKDLSHSLLILTQICQFFRYVTLGNWCFISILPQYIQRSALIQFYDLTSVYPLEETVTLDSLDSYCVPELAYSHQVLEQDSTYVVGCLLLEILEIESPDYLTLASKKIQLLSQILSLSLSPYQENRLSLSQLLNLLVTLRKNLNIPRIWWKLAVTPS